jgi:hypothetical protein
MRERNTLRAELKHLDRAAGSSPALREAETGPAVSDYNVALRYALGNLDPDDFKPPWSGKYDTHYWRVRADPNPGRYVI